MKSRPDTKTYAERAAGKAAAAPATHVLDAIEHEEVFHVDRPDARGLSRARFFAFNTIVVINAIGEERACEEAFSAARDACRVYERLFSRTLPRSDISRVNAARGAAVEIDPRTFAMLERALGYCRASEGAFDVTVGPLVRLWDFKQGVIPDAGALAEAARHVDWRNVQLTCENDTYTVRLADPGAALDAGGIAKGWIADALSDLLATRALSGFIVNLGGNVVVRGAKPDGTPWRIGIRDPRKPDGLAGAVALSSGSAVTSGTYERFFTKGGVRYHHVLDPRTGMPVETDAEGVTVLAERSIDAEGFSITLLAFGIERGCAFARSRPEILQAFFVDAHGNITCAR